MSRPAKKKRGTCQKIIKFAWIQAKKAPNIQAKKAPKIRLNSGEIENQPILQGEKMHLPRSGVSVDQPQVVHGFYDR